MSFRERLIMLVCGAVVLTVLSSALVFSWVMREAVVSESVADARLIGTLLGRGLTQRVSVRGPVAAAVDRLSLKPLMERLTADTDITGVWVFDHSFNRIVAAGPDTTAQRGLAPFEQAMLKASLQHAETQVRLRDHLLTVTAPIQAANESPAGVAMLTITVTRMSDALQWAMSVGLVVALALGTVGIAIAWWWAGTLSRPVATLTSAATDMEYNRFAPDRLEPLAGQRGELAHLARVFQAMAQEVQTRQAVLDEKVRVRTRELEQANATLTASQDRLEKELEVARTVQQCLLPAATTVAAVADVAALMEPARELSGDFYDLVLLADGRLAVVVGDVAGKGVPAAFYMAVTATLLRDTLHRDPHPGAVLARANAVLTRQNPLFLFVTVFLAIYDPRDGAVIYANAGHNPPCLVSPEGRVTPLPLAEGVALGVEAEQPYPETRMALEPGATLLLYTDGITEAFDPAREPFGEDRLAAVLGTCGGASPQTLVAAVESAVQSHIKGAEPSDDLTLVAVRHQRTA